MDETDYARGIVMKRKERINFYRDAAEREEPVFEFFDELDTGMDYDELQEEIKKIRMIRAKIEAALKLDAMPHFCDLLLKLRACINTIRSYRSLRIREIDINKRNGRSAGFGEVERLKELERGTTVHAKTIEDEIYRICVSVDTDPYEFCYLEQLDE